MNWRDKLAVLKLAGYVLYESPNWAKSPKYHWRYVCEKEDDPDAPIGAANEQHRAVSKAFNEYMEALNYEKAS